MVRHLLRMGRPRLSVVAAPGEGHCRAVAPLVRLGPQGALTRMRMSAILRRSLPAPVERLGVARASGPATGEGATASDARRQPQGVAPGRLRMTMRRRRKRRSPHPAWWVDAPVRCAAVASLRTTADPSVSLGFQLA